MEHWFTMQAWAMYVWKDMGHISKALDASFQFPEC